MAESDEAKLEEYRSLLDRDYQLAEEQRRCTNIVFSPAGYTKFEAFEAIARWDIAQKEREVLIHRMAEFYILFPHLRHKFLRIFLDAK